MADLRAEPRKGARSIKEIPAKVLMALELGQIETANLVEWLALNPYHLLRSQLLQLDLFQSYKTHWESLLREAPKGINARQKHIAEFWFTLHGAHTQRNILSFGKINKSDTVRAWTAYSLMHQPLDSLAKRLQVIEPLANDPHFGVREVAWMAFRPYVSAQPREALKALEAWFASPKENLRRFASEVSRPRGVWCAHIAFFKEDPTPAFPLLEQLKSDPSKYVRDSLANWLNDAGKTAPEQVVKLCRSWAKEPKDANLTYVLKRALRNLGGLERLD